MKGRIFACLVVAVLLAWSYFARPVYDYAWIAARRVFDAGVEKRAAPLVRQEYGAVMDAATEQASEIDAYLHARRLAAVDAGPIRQLDFSGTAAYSRSTDALRQRLASNLAYRPADFPLPSEPVQETRLGEDSVAEYSRLTTQISPGIHSIGIFMRPKGTKGRLPLVIVAHGRSGAPDLTADGKLPILAHHNRDLARGALERGWAVWEPTFVFYASNQPENLRERLAARAVEAGTTLPAIEILKVVRGLDALLRRADLDPDRVAMVGVSYGGFYTLYTTALEQRIKAAVVAAYLNDRETVLDSSEPGGFSDWRFPESLTILRDPFIAALVCPRPLQIQAGNQDQLFPIEGARRTAPLAAEFYRKLGVENQFQFLEFVGRHDFNGREAWDFLARTVFATAASPE